MAIGNTVLEYPEFDPLGVDLLSHYSTQYIMQ
jgi:hypothetical protein